MAGIAAGSSASAGGREEEGGGGADASAEALAEGAALEAAGRRTCARGGML